MMYEFALFCSAEFKLEEEESYVAKSFVVVEYFTGDIAVKTHAATTTRTKVTMRVTICLRIVPRYSATV